MLGEFIHKGKTYNIKKRSEPYISGEMPKHFSSINDVQAFFADILQNPINREEIIHIAHWMQPTYCRPPKNCPKSSDKEFLDTLFLGLNKGTLRLSEIKPINCGLFSQCNGAKIIEETDPEGGKRQFFMTPNGEILGWLTAPTQQQVIRYKLNQAHPTAIVISNHGYVGSLDSLLLRYKESKLTYCRYYSKHIGISADAAAIGAVVATVGSGGLAVPGAGIVGVSASVVSITNGVLTLLLCGPALSHVTTIISEIPGPPWWQIATNAVDATITAAGY